MKDDALQKGLFSNDAGQQPVRAAPPVVPVSTFVSQARILVERSLPLQWIRGELSGCSRAPSGHVYFTLKDARAQIRCVFFRSKAQALTFALREGLAVEVRANVLPVYDSTAIHARAAVEWMMVQEEEARAAA